MGGIYERRQCVDGSREDAIQVVGFGLGGSELRAWTSWYDVADISRRGSGY